MLTVRAAGAAAVALALALAGCAGDGQAAPASQPSPSAQEEGAVTDPGAFPDEPVLREQFDDPTSGWPDSGYVDGGYRLALEGDREIVTAPAPLTVEPGNAGVFIESEVTLLGGNGRAGLFCRGARDGQTFYALTIGAGGAWAIERYSDGSPEVIDSGTLPEGIVNPPGEPNLLRLICGAGEPGGPASLAVTINATPLITAQDPASLDPGPASHIGAVILGDNAGAFEARYDNVAVWIAE